MVEWRVMLGAGAGIVALGCNVNLKAVEYENPESPWHDHCDDTFPSTGMSPRSCVAPPDDIDILFVVDNSSSMVDEQARIARNFAAFIDVIDGVSPDIDYRIAVTTTDNSNPLCGGTTTPEAGQLVLSSCRERLGEFVDTSQDPPIDRRAEGCTGGCPFTGAQLDDRMVPTSTYFDPEPRPRPWIERIDGISNLPAEISPGEALACFGPQGVTGCGYESHLESMYKALQRTKSSSEPSYGFLRDEASLLVVFLTDEADCSYRVEFEDIFVSDGDRVFWSDPDTATSGICWNAGVTCFGGPGVYEDCIATEKGPDGEPATDDSLAVLHPVARYADLLAGIRDHKQSWNPTAQVFVSVVAGVPPGFQDGGVPLVFADDADPELQAKFGIGPGCTSEDGAQVARPPARLRALVESLGRPLDLFSICEDDLTPALEPALDALDATGPACYRGCVLDTDDQRPGLQPSCIVEGTIGGQELEVEACAVADDAYVLPADDVDVCYGFRTDPAHTGPAVDDLSEQCIEDGWNLELRLVVRPAVSENRSFNAVCELSPDPETDCPDL